VSGSRFRRALRAAAVWRTDARLDALEAQAASQTLLIRRLWAQTDALRSRLELGDEVQAEFQAWRAANPAPAEPLVSICTGTYNRARLLVERCIPSLLGQSYRRIEVIVVGDGCTDDTAERVARIGDPRLTFVNLPERGRYPEPPELRYLVAGTAAVNHALTLARGDFVTHLDDDDEHLPDRIEKLVRFSAENACDFVWHPFWHEAPSGEWVLNDASEFVYGGLTTSSVFYRSWFTRIPWDVNAWRLQEPGDWNRFRKIKYVGPTAMRFPEPLLRHYRERNQPEYARGGQAAR
jgi:glycosyltransferase involved in cell wall biosynthesis